MTIGEKIRYFREQRDITQKRLAEVTGIHPVSIRKYETNKMQPLPPQIDRIADALSISSNALNGLDNATFRLETVGDLMGIIILLCNSHIIQIDGERGKDDLLKPETLSIHLNPLVAKYLKICTANGQQLSDDLTVQITDPFILRDLLRWEKSNYLYSSSIKEAGNNPNDASKTIISEFAAIKEMIELELQRSMIMLDTSGGIKVKIPPEL